MLSPNNLYTFISEVQAIASLLFFKAHFPQKLFKCKNILLKGTIKMGKNVMVYLFKKEIDSFQWKSHCKTGSFNPQWVAMWPTHYFKNILFWCQYFFIEKLHLKIKISICSSKFFLDLSLVFVCFWPHPEMLMAYSWLRDHLRITISAGLRGPYVVTGMEVIQS